MSSESTSNHMGKPKNNEPTKSIICVLCCVRCDRIIRQSGATRHQHHQIRLMLHMFTLNTYTPNAPQHNWLNVNNIYSFTYSLREPSASHAPHRNFIIFPIVADWHRRHVFGCIMGKGPIRVCVARRALAAWHRNFWNNERDEFASCTENGNENLWLCHEIKVRSFGSFLIFFSFALLWKMWRTNASANT